MKVLIVAGSRVGGTKIGEWLGYELGIEYVHEPFAHWRDEMGLRESFKKIWGKEDIIVKVFPGKEWENVKDLEWDIVIGLVRNNLRECAESIVSAEETNVWHNEYVITAEWLKENTKKIEEGIERVKEWNDRILKDSSIGVRISYEGIYNTKVDRDTLKGILGISEWRFESLLDTQHRYRKSEIKPKPKPTKLI